MTALRFCQLCPPCIVLMLVACQAQTIAMPAETPAVLVQSSDAARTEVHMTVARMLNAPSVTVADDALLHDSLLIIEKVRPRDAQGVQLSGRDFDKPEQFRLIKTGQACVLVRLRTGARETLRQSQCAAVK